MKKIVAVIFSVIVGLICVQTFAQDYPRRNPISLPADAKAILLGQMLGHIVSLDDIVTALGKGDYAMAAQVASDQLGTPRFQKDNSEQGPGLGIGEYLPEEFREISKRFRSAADDFATLAASMPSTPSGEQQQALFAALSKITNECKTCHDSYRIE